MANNKNKLAGTNITAAQCKAALSSKCAVLVLKQDFALEDAISSHAC
jgi:hypothetical protein